MASLATSHGRRCVNDKFGDVHAVLRTKFLPALFGKASLTDSQGQLTCLPVKKAGLVIPDLTEMAGENWTASTVACRYLISALRGKEEFRLVTHQSTMKEERAATRRQNSDISDEKLTKILRKLPEGLSRSIKRGQQTGAWLSVLPSIVNGTELLAEEFRDALTIQYGELPSNFPLHCDGCDAHFTLQHALACKKGGPVIFWHNEV